MSNSWCGNCGKQIIFDRPNGIHLSYAGCPHGTECPAQKGHGFSCDSQAQAEFLIRARASTVPMYWPIQQNRDSTD
jgi:hypothetical protein